MADPFARHPGLRDKITPFAQSFFRDFTTDRLAALMAQHGLRSGWWYDDATREADRAQTLEGRRDADLWVFAYGSLMWDPGLDFAEVRRATAPGHARRFILRDIYGGRGTPVAPGLMAALDIGAGCAGLAFRIARDRIEAETEVLWRREMVAPCYLARFIPVRIDAEEVQALTFIADHAAELIAPDITRDEQVSHLVNGAGFLGTSLDYLVNVVDHLHDMAIPDPDLDALLAEARARRG